jgi:type IV pilus assembly protein PilY1
MIDTFKLRPICRACARWITLAAAIGSAHAGLTDLASAPLETSTAALVKPNIFYVLDDSGSMLWDFLPDWVGLTTDMTLGRNSGYNGVYYNPAITYTPPLKYDGSSYSSMTSANTTGWTKVPYDGFGVQTAANQYSPVYAGYANLLTTQTAGSTQDLTSNAYYYTFIPGEYCTALNLKTCNAQTSPTATYAYPAGLRWCSDGTLTNCQAARIETAPTGGSTYLSPRYPGQTITAPGSATANLSLSGSSSTSVSSVTVNGVQILSATTSSSNTASTLAGYIVSAINACTSAVSGNCGVAGYSASRSGSTVTITSPASLGAITYTPVVTKSGSMTIGASAFSGGTNGVYVPGSNVLTTMVSTTNSYSYPGTSTKASTRTDCAGTTSTPNTCTYAEEMTNYANWWAYYRTRMQMTKTAVTQAFSVLTTSYRLGYMSINNNTGSDFLNVSDITTTSTGQKAQWYQKFTAAKPSNGTGLLVALSTAGRMYAGKLTGSQKLWVNESSGSNTAVTVTDPMQYACQRNYTIVSTDGYWNDTSNPVQINGTTAIGNQDGTDVRPYYDGTGTANTLADVAEYFYITDIRSAALGNATNPSGVDVSSNNVADKQQRMYTSTIGLGASGYMLYQSNYATAKVGDFYDVSQGTAVSASTAANGICSWQTSGNCNWPAPVSNTQTTIDDLWHAAVNGRGNYYSAKNPADLKNGLSNFIQSVNAATSNAAAATTSNPNVASGDNYVFKSTFRSVNWYGELARYTIDVTLGTLSSNADWSESGTAYANATAQTYTTPLLDNLAFGSRSIYTYDPANTTNTFVPFQWSSMTTAMQGLFKISTGAITSLSQLCASGSTCLASSAQVDSTTAGSSTGAGGINLVNFLRGDRSNEGPDATTYYYQRTHVLGDIVDSQAVYVKTPLFSYTDSGYSTYKSNNASRQGMVYVGANDGMLHAFNATTGAEAWAYIPSMVLPNLYKLADKNYSANHSYFVNATPAQGDVYFGSAWHTILVGGLGAGGRGFYALDVTTPSSPSVLWEFTYDTTKSSGYTTDADLGYSYGTPQITKLSDGTWVVLVSSGYNNVSPGSGHGVMWVLNAQTGAIIKKIDTGVGSSTATVTGCTVAPCPSGLAKITAYVTSGSTNNTAPLVYGGDLYGNLWRFNISSLSASGGTATVQLLATLADASGNRQPVTSRAELGNINGSPIIYVGTGSYLGLSDVSNTNVQSIYAIKDPMTTSTATGGIYGSPRASTCTATTNTSCFVKQILTDTSGVRTAASSVSYSLNFNTMYGWFEDLPESGERVNTDPDLQLGTLALTSNIPSTSSACSIGGSSYINYLDYKTGLAVSGATNVGSLLSNGTNTALASAATLVRLSNGKVIAITNLSDGTTVTSSAPIGASSTASRRVSWRELITGQ